MTEEKALSIERGNSPTATVVLNNADSWIVVDLLDHSIFFSHFFQHSKLNEMRRVYFDGTYAAAEDVMRACATTRAWIVKSRNLNPSAEAFLTDACRTDVHGTRGHFERGKYVKHESRGSARFCGSTESTMENLISRIAHDERIADEDKVDVLSRMLRPCHRPVCGECSVCVDASKIAEEYGIYDLRDALRERLD